MSTIVRPDSPDAPAIVAPPLVRDRRRRRRIGGDRPVAGLLFCLPLVAGLLGLTLYPVLVSLWYATCDYDGFSPPVFVGGRNFAELASDGRFWLSIYNTVYYAIFAIPLGNAAGLALALLLNLKVRGMAFYRTMFFLPTIVPLVATCVLWNQLLNPSQGLVNDALRAVGIAHVPGWLTDESWSKPSLILMSIWGCGGGMVLYLAALQDVPQDLHDSAAIDGATAWHRLIHITLPMISPVLMFNLVMGLIGVWQYFAQPMVMTGGGPWDSTLVYSLNLFNTAFTEYRWGYASAMAWVMFVVVLASTWGVFRASNRFVYYQS